MTVAIVDGLEVIQVQQHQRQRLPTGLADFNVAAQGGIEGAAVVQLRQRIDLHLLARVVERQPQLGERAAHLTCAQLGFHDCLLGGVQALAQLADLLFQRAPLVGQGVTQLGGHAGEFDAQLIQRVACKQGLNTLQGGVHGPLQLT